MSRLTNMYYANYDSSAESGIFYDSDNPETAAILRESPSYFNFRCYIENRNGEELLHDRWVQSIHEKSDLTERIEEACGMKAILEENRVRYVYKPIINGERMAGYTFKLTIAYIKLLRKWYISFGHSHLPEVIFTSNIDEKLKNGTYNPIGEQVLQIVCKTKDLIDTFMERLIFIYQFIDEVHKTYKDIEFAVKPDLVCIKMLILEKDWPQDINKTSPKDVIIIELTLDENIQTHDLSYEYIYNAKASAQQKKRCLKKIQEKLDLFFIFPLPEAFERFMKGEMSPQESVSEET